MLEAILGSSSSERALMFILAREEGFEREIARFFETDLTPIQKQLEKLDDDLLKVARKLDNEKFVSKAPAHVVDQQKVRRKSLLEQRGKVEKLRDALNKKVLGLTPTLTLPTDH